MDVVLGIDVGKADFHCALLVDERCRSNSFPNSAAGFERLLGWLGHRKGGAVMRRLLVLAYGVLKSGRPFTPRLASA